MVPSGSNRRPGLRPPTLSEKGGAAGLDSLNLSNVEGCAVEAGGKLGSVKVDALGGGDGAELSTGSAADACRGADGLLEGAVLLGVVAVGAEGGVAGGGSSAAGETLGELARGGGGVRLRAVVDGGFARTLAVLG